MKCDKKVRERKMRETLIEKEHVRLVCETLFQIAIIRQLWTRILVQVAK